MSRPSVRPKRAGEDFTRTLHGAAGEDGDGPSSSKKPRFDLRNPTELAPDALEEDDILDADEIGRGRRVRRNAVNIDGYESDSENEAFEARAEARAKANQQQKNQEEQDDDMFAELKEDFEEADADESRKKKKSVRFLRDEEIEGQVESSRGGHKLRADLSRPDVVEDNDKESDSESDVPDEERARLDEGMDEELGAGSKKKNAPLLDAFNMRAEQEEGRFDEEGNYIRKAADPDAIHDTWLEGVSKKDIKRAREAAARRDAERREKDRETDSILTSDLLRTLITHLERGETVLEALARLGKGLKKKPKWQTKQRNKPKSKMNGTNGAAEDVEMTEDNPEEAARKKAIDEITGAADLLLTRGQSDIYEVERETLTRQYRRETGEEWVDPPQLTTGNGEDNVGDGTGAPGPTMWEFRWSDARDGGQTHGPYDSAMMQSWRDAGYFGEGVEFRRAGDPTSEWTRVATFT
ncbi:hypothetical protein VTN96DRAFT_9109 [Rasamsonia emersonii]|uniref:GYF domain-containing protein n=1 Tax=Rasamsonia emersonii (strain ATCC 16479 / CBS 393.64 / IMI 116815) TaxID=1408163 RepID=A0A0F4YJZ2_RASE3|nr:hypothetical protein T310_8142 [Rasamsonia emersonii CBS 393.64]KKA17913.1 hypothetical protein T310_8142 [Rasamsonia emersonii CBS 393.64]